MFRCDVYLYALAFGFHVVVSAPERDEANQRLGFSRNVLRSGEAEFGLENGGEVKAEPESSKIESRSLRLSDGFDREIVRNDKKFLLGCFEPHPYVSDADSFREVARSDAFVDTTTFIEQFMKRMSSHTVLFAPRRFGKTTAVAMLKDFFQLPVDNEGRILNARDTVAFRTFDKLKIRTAPGRFFERHFANYSVIHVNLGDLEMDSMESFTFSFRRMMNRLFAGHPYLINSTQLTATDKLRVEDYGYPRSRMTIDTLSKGGRLLANYLYKHSKRKCIVLIDDYDLPAVNVMLSKEADDDSVVTDMFQYISKFIAGFVKDNVDNVFGSLLTGALRAGSVYTNEANNLDFVQIFDDQRIAECFGYTSDDVETLLERFVMHRQDQYDTIKRMYSGYCVKDSKEKLYNMYAITEFLKSGGDSSSPHWKGPNEVRKNFRQAFQSDVFGQVVEKSLDLEVPIVLRLNYKRENIFEFRSLISGRLALKNDSKKYEHMMFQYLLENGFYTITERAASNAVKIIVPNREVKGQVERFIYSKHFFKAKFQIPESTLVEYVASIDKLDENRASYIRLLKAIERIFEKNTPERETEFQGPLLIYPSLCVETFKEVFSEHDPQRQNGDGIFLRRHDEACVVIELRINQETSHEALRQIVDNKYFESRLKKHQPLVKVFVGVYIDKEGHYTLSYLWNSDDLSDSKHIYNDKLKPTTEAEVV